MNLTAEQIARRLAPHAEMMAGRLWQGILGLPDYLISDRGEVLSLVHKRPRFLKPIRMGEYWGVQLKSPDGLVKRYVHRLVTEAFCGPAPAGTECRHLDGDRGNFAASNLAWGTRAENHADKIRHGTDTSGERHFNAKLTRSQVEEMRRIRRDTGLSHRKIAAQFGVTAMTAYRAIEGQSWKR